MLNQSTYCPVTLYDAVVALQFLQRDNTSNAITADGTGWNNYLDLVKRIQNHNFGQRAGVPTDATTIDTYFTNIYLPKVISDLHFTAEHPTAYSTSASNFAADAVQLDGSLLPQAAQYGKTLAPSTAELASSLAAVAH